MAWGLGFSVDGVGAFVLRARAQREACGCRAEGPSISILRKISGSPSRDTGVPFGRLVLTCSISSCVQALVCKDSPVEHSESSSP